MAQEYDEVIAAREAYAASAGGNSLYRADLVDDEGDPSALAGVVQLDSFAGATDDLKLTAALAYAAAQTKIPWIQFPARDVTLNVGGRTPFSGMKLIAPGYPFAPGNLEVSSTLATHRVSVGSAVTTGTNSLFHGTGTYYGVSVVGLKFQNNARTAQFWNQPTGTLYNCLFDSLTFYAFKHVFGNPTTNCAFTGVTLSGQWVINGFANGNQQIHIGGSDCELWTSGFLNMEGGTATTGGAGEYQIWFESLSKTNIGGIFVTCKEGWLGIRISGASTKSINLRGIRAEGRNAATPCHGSTIRIEAGNVTLSQPWVAYGMSSPSSHGGGSLGVIHVAGGDVVIDRPYYERATGVEETVPLVYHSAGTLNISCAAKVGSWSGFPRVQSVGTNITVDTSVIQTAL